LVNGCVNKIVCGAEGQMSARMRDTVGQISENLPMALEASVVEKASRLRYTELAGTTVSVYRLATVEGVRPEMLIAKRYDLDELRALLKRHFSILCESSDLPDGQKKGRAIFLMRKHEGVA
jgi:hypothetical protein